MREIKVGDASITLKTNYANFDIETRKSYGVAVYIDGKRVADWDASGKKIKLKKVV